MEKNPIPSDAEWVQYEFADKTKIASIADGRHFQYAEKCNYIPPEPTPTPTPTQTPTPTLTPTPTPYFYSGDFFSVVNLQNICYTKMLVRQITNDLVKK